MKVGKQDSVLIGLAGLDQSVINGSLKLKRIISFKYNRG